MNEGYIIRDQRKMHFLTFTVVDWVDIFTRKDYRDIIIESFKYCQKEKGMIIYSYVIMSNHIHCIIQSEIIELSDLIRDFKKFTAQMILKRINEGMESRADWMLKRFEFAAKSNLRNSKFQFWQINNHPEEIFTEKFLWTKINYIHLNPIRAGIVLKGSEYLYSSASNYVTNQGLLNIEIPSNPIINPLSKSGFDIDISLW